MIIIGAGIAGLLAAQYFRHHKPEVFEASPTPIKNHSAVLRFRSDAIQNLTGIRMERVTVRKAILDYEGELQRHCSIRDANAYSLKVTRGSIGARSIWDLEPVQRWIPPDDFVERMADGLNINYGSKVDSLHYSRETFRDQAVISTIPMHIWANARGIAPVLFRSHGITTITARIECCNVHQTVYMPYSSHSAYRASIVGDRLIMELMNDADPNTTLFVVEAFLIAVGIEPSSLIRSSVQVTRQERGKIVPLPQAERRALVADITQRFGVYSLGKFATWRQIVADDIIGDLKRIEGIIAEGSYGLLRR